MCRNKSVVLPIDAMCGISERIWAERSGYAIMPDGRRAMAKERRRGPGSTRRRDVRGWEDVEGANAAGPRTMRTKPNAGLKQTGNEAQERGRKQRHDSQMVPRKLRRGVSQPGLGSRAGD